MTEKLRLWLLLGLSEAQGPANDGSLWLRTDSFTIKAWLSLQHICLHFVISSHSFITGCWHPGLYSKPVASAEWLGRLLWFPSFMSPCFWLPLSSHLSTHILDITRGYRLSMPINGSLCNYDYVQPCAPGPGLNHRTLFFEIRKNTN